MKAANLIPSFWCYGAVFLCFLFAGRVGAFAFIASETELGCWSGISSSPDRCLSVSGGCRDRVILESFLNSRFESPFTPILAAPYTSVIATGVAHGVSSSGAVVGRVVGAFEGDNVVVCVGLQMVPSQGSFVFLGRRGILGRVLDSIGLCFGVRLPSSFKGEPAGLYGDAVRLRVL